jgi:hypothetical protein
MRIIVPVYKRSGRAGFATDGTDEHGSGPRHLNAEDAELTEGIVVTEFLCALRELCVKIDSDLSVPIGAIRG